MLLVAATTVANEKWTFEDAQVGKAPQGWIAGETGSKKGKAPRWEVRQDEGRNVLAQLESGGARSDFPVCLKKNSSFKEGVVSVRLKPISGNVDQAGGVVFRAKDKDNFYIVRANAKENNVSFYYNQDGKRTTIKFTVGFFTIENIQNAFFNLQSFMYLNAISVLPNVSIETFSISLIYRQIYERGHCFSLLYI